MPDSISRTFSITAVFLASCASCANLEPTRTGFLSGYDGLEVRESDLDGVLAHRAEARWTDYGTVVVEPVVLKGDAAESEVALALAAHLQQQLREQLQPSGGAGQRRVIVRAALTGFDLVDPVLNTLSLVALWITLDNGGAAVELELIDAATTTPIYRLSAADTGSVFAVWKGFQCERQAREALDEIVAIARAEVSGTPTTFSAESK